MNAYEAVAEIREAIRKSGHSESDFPIRKMAHYVEWMDVIKVDIYRWIDEEDIWFVEKTIESLPKGEFNIDIN